MSRPKAVLKKLGMREVTFFRIANRRGIAAIAKRHLTEGRTALQAYSRLVKACRRSGYDLPEKEAGELPALK